jgi:hypothetical protein
LSAHRAAGAAVSGEHPSGGSDRIVSFPVSPEEHARRLKVEAERLARLSPAEWIYYVTLDGYAEKYGVDQATLKTMVEAVVKDNEKKAREDRGELRRAEKQRTTARRESERKQERKEREEERRREREEREARKEAERKDKEKQKALDAIVKLPKGEHEAELRQLARRLGEDLDGLRAELEILLAAEEEAVRREAEQPWPEPVAAKELLDEILVQLRRYVVIHDDNAATIYAVSVLFAWCHDEVAVYSPLFVVQGADIDMAKSLLCRIHSLLSPRSYVLGKPTGPAIYRLVDHVHPSMYVDNGDRLLARDRDAADVVDLSWTRGTLIPRTVKGVIHNFDPFCFKMHRRVAAPGAQYAVALHHDRDAAEAAGRGSHRFQEGCERRALHCPAAQSDALAQRQRGGNQERHAVHAGGVR